MTAVLLFGDVPSTGYVTGANAERVTVDGNQPTLDGFTDIVRERLNRSPAVLVLYPSWQSGQNGGAARAIGLARTALATPHLVGVASDLPPLALSLVADQLAYLAPYVPPGVLTTLASQLAAETLSGAWVRSVAGLEHVSPSLSQHLTSYLPGGFMVTVTPTATVHRITGKSPMGVLPFRPTEPVQMLTANADGDSEWLQKHLLPILHPVLTRNYSPQPLGNSYWSDKKYIEFVAFSGHPQALAQAANSLRVRLCRWCDQPVTATKCPFCGMMLERHDPEPAASGTDAGHSVRTHPPPDRPAPAEPSQPAQPSQPWQASEPAPVPPPDSYNGVR